MAAAAAKSLFRLSSLAAASRSAPGARVSLRPRLRLPNATAAPRFLTSRPADPTTVPPPPLPPPSSSSFSSSDPDVVMFLLWRSPVEMSFCVESLMPMHSAKAVALMRSMLSVPGKGCGWIIEGNDDR